VKVSDMLDTKVGIALSELAITADDRSQLDYDIFPAMAIHRDGRIETVYHVALFLRVDAADQVAIHKRMDPYSSQELVDSDIRELWAAVCDARDSHISAVAPGLIPPAARRSAGGLYVP
jgi:hypothetical protein